MTADHDDMEHMYLVRNRAGGDTWAEWDDIWPDLIRKVSERVEEQKGTHPGFDVIEVVIERHAVVRPSVAIEEGAVVGWHDAPTAAPNESLDAASHAQPLLSVTATNDASTASPTEADTPSPLSERTK